MKQKTILLTSFYFCQYFHHFHRRDICADIDIDCDPLDQFQRLDRLCRPDDQPACIFDQYIGLPRVWSALRRFARFQNVATENSRSAESVIVIAVAPKAPLNIHSFKIDFHATTSFQTDME